MPYTRKSHRYGGLSPTPPKAAWQRPRLVPAPPAGELRRPVVVVVVVAVVVVVV